MSQFKIQSYCYPDYFSLIYFLASKQVFYFDYLLIYYCFFIINLLLLNDLHLLFFILAFFQLIDHIIFYLYFMEFINGKLTCFLLCFNFLYFQHFFASYKYYYLFFINLYLLLYLMNLYYFILRKNNWVASINE